MGRHIQNLHHLPPVDEEAADRLHSRLTEIIVSLAEARCLSQSDLARAMNLRRGTLCKMIRRAPGGPSMWQLWHLCAISRILKVPVSELMRAAEQDSGNRLLKKHARQYRARIATRMKKLDASLALIQQEEERHGND